MSFFGNDIRIRTPRLTLWVLVLALALLCACGDEGLQSGPGGERVQGVWEGTLRLSTPGDSVALISGMRLELIQSEYTFQGYLLKIDPLAGGFGLAAVDTFLVVSGYVSTTFVSFRALDPEGGSPAVFDGQLKAGTLAGSVIGTGFIGHWDARWLH